MQKSYLEAEYTRYDISYKYIFILAGIDEGIEIIIFEDGKWEFYEDDQA
jgi:hypothetical protein